MPPGVDGKRQFREVRGLLKLYKDNDNDEEKIGEETRDLTRKNHSWLSVIRGSRTVLLC